MTKCPHCEYPITASTINCPACNKDVRPSARGVVQQQPEKPCPYCAKMISLTAVVCPYCTRTLVGEVLSQPIPKDHILPIAILVVGMFTMLAGTSVSISGALVFVGWLISLVGAALVLRGNSPIVRYGGAFVLSLFLMAAAASCRM
jgi:hypothetical protein